MQSRLLHLAESKCLSFLIELRQFKPFLQQLSFLLVGSVATGLCREDSDIDIAAICEKDIFAEISKNTRWVEGIPTETMIDDVQFHYYATTFNEIEKKLKEQDDMYMYVYGYAKILKDPKNAFNKFIGKYKPNDPEIRRQRIEGKADMLNRRTKALNYALETQDLFGITEICKELIALSLKIVALLDDVPFEPRKRLFQTCLHGQLGQQIKPEIKQLFTDMGAIGQLEEKDDFKNFVFLQSLKKVATLLLDNCKLHGFSTGLLHANYRHRER
jgi:predicted nucleotidyltransferase